MESFESAARFIFAVLLTGLWQGALLAGVAWLVLRSARGMNATTRHAVLASALLASLVLPVVTVILTFDPASATQTTNPSTAVHGSVARSTVAVRHAAISSGLATTVQGASASPGFQRARFVLPRGLVLALVAIWLLGALVVLGRLVVSLVHLERLKRDALPLPVEYRQRLDRWTGAAKGSRDVRLCRSGEIVIPIAVGLFDAMILVPEQLVEELAPQDVDRILLHELAHLRRADDWFNALERIAQALLFFNPGVQWVVRQLDLEREVACDDWVLAQTHEPLPYASCLAKVAEVTMWPYRAMAAPGAFVTRKSMSIRIERLLAAHRDVRIRLSYGPVGTAAVALIALCIGAAYVAPSIAYPLLAIVPVAVRPAAAHPVPARLARVGPAPITRSAVRIAPRPVAAQGRPNIVPFHVETHAATHVGTHVATHVETHATMHVAPRVDIPAAAGMIGDRTSSGQTIVADAAARSSYIDELASAGYSGLSLDDLIQLKSVGVSAAYIRDLAAAGFTHPSVRDLIEMRSLGVTGAYIRSLRGYSLAAPLSLRDIEEYRSLGITADYAKDLAGAGFPSLTMKQLAEARSLGVTGDYIRGLRSYAGSAPLAMRDITEFRALGITAQYVAEMASAGYGGLAMRDLEELKAMGIDGAFVRKAADHGFKNLTIKQLVNLKASGIL